MSEFINTDALRPFFAGSAYHIHTYGCQLNENDSEKIAGILEEIGMSYAEDPADASVIVLNTCTIRENANSKFFGNLGMIKGIKKKDPEIIVAVCGCMMKEPHNVERIRSKYKFVDIVFGPSDIYKLPEMLFNRMNDGRSIIDIGDQDVITEDIPIIHKRKFRALTTIIYGCNNFCSYCIVPYVRGRERSRDPESVIKELRDLGERGFREVMLLGQNVNSYGRDLDGFDFSDLLRAASEIKTLDRIRFMTSHPKDTSMKLLDVMSAGGNIMPHLHLPVQSGSDAILKKMNRKYTSSKYREIVDYARKVIPDIAITTDIIVGFPGETDDDFNDTLGLMKKIKFDNAFTFMFSPRKGTPAYDLTGQIPEDVIKERFDRLVELQNKHSLESNQKAEGTVQEVLVEGPSQNSRKVFTGRTPHNRLVNFTGQIEDPEGVMAEVLITKAKTFSLDGELIRIKSSGSGII